VRFGSYSFQAGGALNTVTLRLDNATNELYFNQLNYLKDILPEMGRNLKLIYTVGFYLSSWLVLRARRCRPARLVERARPLSLAAPRTSEWQARRQADRQRGKSVRTA
jgi:hypothetical protein